MRVVCLSTLTMQTPNMQQAPFWGPGTTPVQAIWMEFRADGPTGISGPALFFILNGEIRFGQRCEQQLFLFGDTVYSAWRVWRLSPNEFIHNGNLSLVPFGRYWWPQMQWKGKFDDLPADSMLNMEYKTLTPDEYNHADPLYTPSCAACRSPGGDPDSSLILDVSLHVLLLAVITVSSRGGRWGLPIAMGSFSLRVTLGGQGSGPTSSQWIRNVPTRIPVP